MVAPPESLWALLLLALCVWPIDDVAASRHDRFPHAWTSIATATATRNRRTSLAHREITFTPPRGGSSSLHSDEPQLQQDDKENVDGKVSATPASSGNNSIVTDEPSPPNTQPLTDVDLPQSQSRRNRFLALLNKALHRKKPEEISKKLKNRNTTNLSRKLLHASFGLTFAALNHFIPRRVFVTGMTVLSTGTLLMELLRYNPRFHFLNDILHGILGSSLRKHEMEGKFTGSFYFFLGVTVTAAAFDRNCATLGMAQLALADPSASYFGRATRHVYWSRIENGLGGFGRNKGVLGFLGGALFCFPFNYQVLSLARYNYKQKNGDNERTPQQLPGGTTAIVAASLALGFAGAFADLAVPTPAVVLPKKVWGIPVPPLHIDDNFVVPIVSAWACQKVFAILHWNTDAVKLATFLILKGPQNIPLVKRNKKGADKMKENDGLDKIQ